LTLEGPCIIFCNIYILQESIGLIIRVIYSSYAKNTLLHYGVAIISIFLQNILVIMHFSVNEEFSIFLRCSVSASPSKALKDFSSNQGFKTLYGGQHVEHELRVEPA
jgi:hypothetical protein